MTDIRRNLPRGFFGDSFDDFDLEFQRMREHMDRIFSGSMQSDLSESDRLNPFVYGFSMSLGPDGVPHVHEFGNIKKQLTKENNFDEGFGREPLIDIIKDEQNISITAERPGVEKDDIDVDLQDSRLVISVDTEHRKYNKEIDLPDEVDKKTIKATYKNGILDISLKRVKPSEPKSRKINIE